MAPKRQVITIEQKKASILKFFQDDFAFYSMKDLEKLIPKKCAGVSPVIVKELVTAMIEEDGVISCEKCGQINVYWCFKNQVVNKIYNAAEHLKADKLKIQGEIYSTNDILNITIATTRQEEFEVDGENFNRNRLLESKRLLEKTIIQKQRKLEDLEDIRWDSHKIIDKKREINSLISMIDIATDNMELLVVYLSKRSCLESSQIRQELSIPSEFQQYEMIAL
ncbi:uncharacterized protein GWK60_L09185 [Nakaseomyces glabratus]|nr:Mnd1 HTH domain [Nakaseomyces glabratus]QNG16352.1 uncharacterized protein GWK60_L09185 [Nakaseomyces glabratus]